MIKLVALDIYGTVLNSDFLYTKMPPRKGLEDFFDYCDLLRVPIISASDAETEYVKFDLGECFTKYPERRMSTERFSGFVEMNKDGPKYFSLVLWAYRVMKREEVNPRELLVIGDMEDRDIAGARAIGAQYIHVPEYAPVSGNEFDFSEIDLGTFK